MSETIHVRPYADADLPEVLDVMRAALGETALLERTPELFAWKHFDNPFGRSLVLVADAGDRIAGLRAFMRWRLVTPSGRQLSCVRAVDTATHPDFHRRGIFRRLTLEAVDAARADGVDLIFNTPNPKSRRGYLSMGWADVGPVGVMIRPHLRWLRRGDHAIDTGRLEPVPEGVDGADRAPRGLRTPRSATYLEWRFRRHPTARYFCHRDSGALAMVRPNVRNGRREMVVSDVIGSRPGPVMRRAAAGGGTDYTVAWFSRGTPERRAALRSGLLPVPRKQALWLVANPLRDLDLDVSDLTAWDLALGDLELL